MQNLWEIIYFEIEIGIKSTNRTWMKVNGEQILSIMGGDAEKFYAQQNTRLDNYFSKTVLENFLLQDFLQSFSLQIIEAELIYYALMHHLTRRKEFAQGLSENPSTQKCWHWSQGNAHWKKIMLNDDSSDAKE